MHAALVTYELRRELSDRVDSFELGLEGLLLLVDLDLFDHEFGVQLFILSFHPLESSFILLHLLFRVVYRFIQLICVL